MKFRDYFSEHADDYSRYRPGYPGELFDYLASLVPECSLAWDCGTGNGQAALELAERFQKVIATDASDRQIANAFHHPRIEYRVEPSEHTSLETHSTDLITVATAVHWFDFDLFYQEARRVGKAGSILAVWGYWYPVIQPDIDRLVRHYDVDVVYPFWPERNRYQMLHYRTLPFPFEEIQPPPFEMQAEWDLNQMVGFIGSWSATRRYFESNGSHPLELIIEDLERSWGERTQKRRITWPLHMRIGKLS